MSSTTTSNYYPTNTTQIGATPYSALCGKFKAKVQANGSCLTTRQFLSDAKEEAEEGSAAKQRREKKIQGRIEASEREGTSQG